ncbi:MAG: glycosyltransferase family 4 protein [Verrucomicrobia bacterium]|nr:glycosyltransferase family 4 protein [Verrucomicrobiota bacterium]
MRVAVHSQVLTARELFGIGYYLFNLMNAIGKLNRNDEYFLLSGRPIGHLPSGNNITAIPKSPGIPRNCFSYLGFPIGVSKAECDLAFLPKEVAPFGLSVPAVITAYDLYPFIMPKEFKSEYPLSSAVHHHLARRLHFRRASKILAISQSTKNDLVEICGVSEEKVIVTPLGADPLFFERLAQDKIEQVLQKYTLRRPFFLNTSSHWWGRKNLSRLIQAFAIARKKHSLPHQLIITGKPGPSLENMKLIIRTEGLEKEVKLLSYVERTEIVAMMQCAEALIFPSLHEGFGLPVLEAMAAECPVVTSNGSALKEVAGECAILVDPLDTDCIAEAIGRIATNPALREQMIACGKRRAHLFTWENTARITMETFSATVG